LQLEADDNLVTPTQQSTFFENAQSSLSSPLFAAYLPYQRNGAYDFGATDSSRYSGSIQTTSVDSSQGFWAFTSDSYSVDSTSYSSSGTIGIAG
jgi:aspergillopepsin I